MNASASTSTFTRAGPLAQPAGLACGALKQPVSGLNLECTWNATNFSTFSKPGSMPAHVAPPGWKPKEPSVHPSHTESGAGIDSTIDNTMRFSPLPPRWGKTRVIQPSEHVYVRPSNSQGVPRKLSPDTLSAAKGFDKTALASLPGGYSMCAVLPPYAPTASIFTEKFEPSRINTGFVNSPTNLAGRFAVDESNSTFKSSFQFNKSSPNSSPTSTMAKFQADQNAALPHIPVASRKMIFQPMM